MGWRPGLELLKVNAQVLLNRTINSLFQWPRNLPLHAGIAPLFICLSEQVCPFTYLINDTEIRNCVCRGTFQAGLCLQQYHMFVQCIHSQSGLLLLLSHMFSCNAYAPKVDCACCYPTCLCSAYAPKITVSFIMMDLFQTTCCFCGLFCGFVSFFCCANTVCIAVSTTEQGR